MRRRQHNLRLGAISVDLDSLPHYCRIHGLPETMLDAAALDLVAKVAIPRLLEVIQHARACATLFVIGADVGSEAMAKALQAAHRAGFELANHSYSHDYDLSRKAPDVVAQEVARGEAALVALDVPRPAGFRAPGYTLSPELLSTLADRGYTYDSSAFPAAPYYFAKAGVMAALGLLGRPSRAVLDSPRVLCAPRTPYRPSLGSPYARGSAPLLELPISVSPWAKVPFIGTVATTFPWPLVKRVFRSLADDALLNFELHAIDFLDASDGVPQALVRQQRDLSVPSCLKLERLAQIFSWMGEGRRCVTLGQAAGEFAELDRRGARH